MLASVMFVLLVTSTITDKPIAVAVYEHSLCVDEQSFSVNFNINASGDIQEITRMLRILRYEKNPVGINPAAYVYVKFANGNILRYELGTTFLVANNNWKFVIPLSRKAVAIINGSIQKCKSNDNR